MAEDAASPRRPEKRRGRVIVAIAIIAGIALGIGIRLVRQQAAVPPEQDASAFAAVEPTITEYLQRPVRAAGDRLPEDLSPPRCALTNLGSAELSADTTRWFVVYRCAQFRRSRGALSVDSAWGGPVAVDVHIGETGPGVVQVQEPGEGPEELAALLPADLAARVTGDGAQLQPSEQVLRERAQEWFANRAQAEPT